MLAKRGMDNISSESELFGGGGRFRLKLVTEDDDEALQRPRLKHSLSLRDNNIRHFEVS